MSRNAEICEMRRQGKTLKEIGKQFGGLTRERVRQITACAGIAKPTKQPKPEPWGKKFGMAMGRALRSSGYVRCYGSGPTRGHWYLAIPEYNCNRCPSCRAEHRRILYHRAHPNAEQYTSREERSRILTAAFARRKAKRGIV